MASSLTSHDIDVLEVSRCTRTCQDMPRIHVSTPHKTCQFHSISTSILSQLAGQRSTMVTFCACFRSSSFKKVTSAHCRTPSSSSREVNASSSSEAWGAKLGPSPIAPTWGYNGEMIWGYNGKMMGILYENI